MQNSVLSKNLGDPGRSLSFLGVLRLTFVNGNLKVPRPMPRFTQRRWTDRFFVSHLSLQESHAGSARIPAGNGALQNPRMHGQRIGPTRPPGGRKTSHRISTYQPTCTVLTRKSPQLRCWNQEKIYTKQVKLLVLGYSCLPELEKKTPGANTIISSVLVGRFLFQPPKLGSL